jgi:hypothetical protein
VYTIDLPFSVCITDTCSSRVNPTSNGIISLAEYRTAEYYNVALPAHAGNAVSQLHTHTHFPRYVTVTNNLQVLSALWQDSQIYRGKSQWMSYTVCGDAGKRTVTFDWRVSKYMDTLEAYRFSATFYEDQPGRIILRYFEMSDKGVSATVGIEGRSRGQGKCATIKAIRDMAFANVFQLLPRCIRTSKLRLLMVLLLFGTLLRPRGAPLYRHPSRIWTSVGNACLFFNDIIILFCSNN